MIATIQMTEPALSVRRLCQFLGVGRSWYYARPTGEAVAACDGALRDAVERIVLSVTGDGYRRVMHAVARAGWVVNYERGLRVMRQESLLCQLARRFGVTTDSVYGYRRYPNLRAGREVVRPDQAWVADST